MRSQTSKDPITVNFKSEATCNISFFKTNNSYKPIPCEFYDWLEIWSMRGQLLNIIFEENSETKSITSTITDLHTKDGIEYLKTSNNTLIRLDDLLRITELV